MTPQPNALQRYCAETGADPCAVLTWLQCGIPNTPVSDLCQSVSGVEPGDAERAVARIRAAKARLQKQNL